MGVTRFVHEEVRTTAARTLACQPVTEHGENRASNRVTSVSETNGRGVSRLPDTRSQGRGGVKTRAPHSNIRSLA